MEKDPHKFMSMLMENYTVKPSIVGNTKLYLDVEIGKVDYGDG